MATMEQLPPSPSPPPMGWLQDDSGGMPMRRMLHGLRIPPVFAVDDLDGFVPGPLFGHEVKKMGIDSTNPTTATIYWQPATILVAHDEHTVLIEGLVRVSGTRVHIDQTGMIHIMVIDVSSG